MILKDYFEDLYNIDTQKQVAVHMCTFDGFFHCKGERTECKNYRDINLLTVVGKIFIYLLFYHFPPPLQGQHASCHEMSHSKIGAKLKKKKKNKIYSLCPLSCRLSHKRTSTLQRLHIGVATHNCGIPSRSGVHPPGYTS